MRIHIRSVVKHWKRTAYLMALLACLCVGIALTLGTSTVPQQVAGVSTDGPAAQQPAAASVAASVAAPTVAAVPSNTTTRSEPSQSSGSPTTKVPAQATQSSRAEPTPASSGATQATVSPAPSAPPQQSLSVTLSVDFVRKGTLELAPGSTHCDVLSTALARGLISSLVMRYNKALGSNGVYVIDGKGDDNVVWWVYTVNGKSPPWGCSKVQVRDGDNINWDYIRS